MRFRTLLSLHPGKTRESREQSSLRGLRFEFGWIASAQLGGMRSKFIFSIKTAKILIVNDLPSSDTDRGRQNIEIKRLAGKILQHKDLASVIGERGAAATVLDLLEDCSRMLHNSCSFHVLSKGCSSHGKLLGLWKKEMGCRCCNLAVPACGWRGQTVSPKFGGAPFKLCLSGAVSRERRSKLKSPL